MKVIFTISLLILSVFMLGATALGQSSGDYRSATSGNWNATATWETYNGSAWVAASATPTSSDGAITIRNGHTVTVTASVTVDQVTVDAGGQITINSGFGMTLANGTGTDLTINGTVLNSGNALFSAAGPTWVVNAGGTYIHNTTAGISTPFDGLTLDSLSNFIYRGSSSLNTAVTFSARTFGNLTIESSSGKWSKTGVTGSATMTVKGNLSIGGTGAGTVTFNHSGASSPVVIYGTVTTVTSDSFYTTSGAYTFYNTITNNGGISVTAGSSAAVFNGTTTISGNNVTFTNGFTVNAGKTLAIATNGTLIGSGKTGTVNGTFQLNEGGWPGSHLGTFSYNSSTGTLVFNKTSSAYGPIDTSHYYWPSTNAPANVTVQGAGINLSIAKTVTGTFQTSAGVTNGNNLTLNGNVQINNGGYFTGSPTYGSSSVLIYNTGTTYGRNAEWNAASGAGAPASVQVTGNTTLNYTNQPTATNINLTLTGNLTIDAGSSLYMDYGSPGWSNSLSVNGNVVLNGNLSLGDAAGGDLNIGGNWTYSPGAFNARTRAVTFNGTGTQTITGATTFDYLTVNKSSGTVSLANNVTVNNALNVTTGTLTTNANKVTLGSSATLNEAGSGKIVIGNVEATRTVGGANETFGSIGLELSPNATPYPGSTTVTRVTGTAPTGGGNQGIKRYYDVNAATSSGLNLNMVFHYDDAASELNGKDETKLYLFKSTNSGTTWTAQGLSSLNTTANTISLNNVTDLSRWTASDSTNPLITAASTSSDIVTAAGESATISSLINDASPLSSSTGAQAWQVTIRDGGGAADADALPTTLTAITFTQGTGNQVSDWSQAILAADLFDGTTHLASGVISSTSIAFSGLSAQAPDDGSKTLSLRISLKNPLGTGVADNQKFVFAVTSGNVTSGTGAVSSQFASFTTTNSDNTKDAIAVTASKLVFTTQPSSTGTSGTALTQQPVVTAEDANGNKDLDYTGTVTLTNSGSYTMSGNAAAASSGVVTYTSLAITGTGSVTLSTTNGDGLTDATSNSITLSAGEPTVQASALTFSSISMTSAILSWTNGNGAKRIVVGRSGSAVSTNPTDGTTYSGNAAFGSGTAIGSGFAIYADTGSTVTVSGLTAGTTYFFAVYEFNGSSGLENYLTTSPATGSVTPGYIQSATTGNWSSPSTWVGGVLPTSSDDVIIGPNSTVTVDDGNAVCRSMIFNSSTTSKISFASSSVLSVYGDFTLKSTTQNAIGTWATGAKLKFTGSAATQKLSGWNTSTSMATSFMEMQVDKNAGIVTTDKSNEKINIGTSLEIINGSFVLDTTDDINGRVLDGSSSTPTFTIQSNGTFSVRAGATQIQSGTTAGTAIGLVTIYGNIDLSTTSTNKINFGGVSIENGGTLTLNTGGNTGLFNPGTITVKSGGVLLNSTTVNVWFGGSTVDLQTGGVYKTTTSTTTFPPNFNNNGTVRYQRTASGDQTIADMNYHRLEISFSGNKVWALGATRTISDSLEVNNSATLVISAASAQTLTLNGVLRLTTGTLDNSNGNAILSIANGDWISRATGQITNAPQFGTTVNVRYTSVSGSVTTGPELPTASSVLGNLTISSTGQTVTLSADATVNGTFSLSSGQLLTNGKTLYVSSTGSTSRTSGWVVGPLKRAIGTGATTATFDIGDTTRYTPITVTFGNVTGANDLTASTTSMEHPNVATSGIDGNKSVNRYYTMTDGGLTFDNYSATFEFDSTDIDAGANANNFIVRKYNASAWLPTTTGTRTSTSTQASGMTSFGDFAVGEPITHTITASASAGGSIAPSGAVSVNDQDNKSFTITANPNYHIDSVVVNGVNQGAISSYTFTNVTTDQTISAYFSIDAYTLTVVQSSHGTITPGTTVVNYGGEQAFSITPEAGYHIDSVMVDGIKVDSLAHYTFTNVSASHTITARYSITSYPLNIAIVGNGNVTKSPDAAQYAYGTVVEVTAHPDSIWYFAGWSGDTVSSDNPISVTVNGAKNVTATFVNIPVYAITATAGTGGTITPSGLINVQQGEEAEFAIAPSTGYHIVSLAVDSVDVPDSLTHYTFHNVTRNHTISATFALNTYTMTVTQTSNGTITPGTTTVTYGSNQAFSIAPSTGYHVDSVFVDGIYNHDSTTSYTFHNVTGDHSLTATYAINTYTITASAGTNGAIAPGTSTVNYGTDKRFLFLPNSGYHVDSVFVDGSLNTDSIVGFTFKSITANHTIRVTFKINAYTITVTHDTFGNVTPGTVSATYGSNQRFTFTPNTGYHVDSVFADGVYKADSTVAYTFTNITMNHTLRVTFKINSYTLTVTQGNHGTIAPGTSTVTYGGSQAFTVTPDAGYHVDTVFVDGTPVDSTTSYTFTNVAANHSLTAKYALNTYTLTINKVGSGDVVKNPDQATYTYGSSVQLTATPATGWLFSSWSGDVSDTNATTSVVMNNNKSVTATFTQNPVYLVKYRTFNPDSLALSKDNAGKLGKPVAPKPTRVQFSFTVAPDSSNVDGLHVEFGTAIDTNETFSTDRASHAVPVAKSGLKKWNFTFTSSINHGDPVVVSGYGNKAALQKVSAYWWTRNNVMVGKKLSKPILNQNDLRLPMPNRINALQETFTQGGFSTTGGMVIGIAQASKDSAKKYGWVLLKGYADVVKSLSVTSKGIVTLHSGQPRGFDSVIAGKGMKSFVGKYTSLPPTKQNNKLFANLVALKASITASKLQKTPLGLGELVFEDTAANMFNGMMLKKIADTADVMMTGYPGRTFAGTGTYSILSATIEKVLNAFEGRVDTFSFAGKVQMKGTKALIDVPFLRVDPLAIPDQMKPIVRTNAVPEQYALQQNYPNPFNPTTTIEFNLPVASTVTLTIYNILGQRVATVLDHQNLDEGTQAIQFDATNVASGVYLYRITAESVNDDGARTSFTSIKKMVLTK